MTLLARWREDRERRRIARRRWALRAYYTNAPLWLPPRPTFRQFRVALEGPRGRPRFRKIDDRVRTMIMERRDAASIRAEVINRGMKTMFQDGLAKALLGETTLEEVFRVAL